MQEAVISVQDGKYIAAVTILNQPTIISQRSLKEQMDNKGTPDPGIFDTLEEAMNWIRENAG